MPDPEGIICPRAGSMEVTQENDVLEPGFDPKCCQVSVSPQNTVPGAASRR